MTLQNIEGYFGKVSEVAELIDIWMDQMPEEPRDRYRPPSRLSASLSERGSTHWEALRMRELFL